jgi:hypothetical protein
MVPQAPSPPAPTLVEGPPLPTAGRCAGPDRYRPVVHRGGPSTRVRPLIRVDRERDDGTCRAGAVPSRTRRTVLQSNANGLKAFLSTSHDGTCSAVDTGQRAPVPQPEGAPDRLWRSRPSRRWAHARNVRDSSGRGSSRSPDPPVHPPAHPSRPARCTRTARRAHTACAGARRDRPPAIRAAGPPDDVAWRPGRRGRRDDSGARVPVACEPLSLHCNRLQRLSRVRHRRRGSGARGSRHPTDAARQLDDQEIQMATQLPRLEVWWLTRRRSSCASGSGR